ncbi:MAG: PTS sugar transporter subunit IIA [bacterium]|nr:PTS sugar transporter subunit IIA [bacterium]
MRLVEVVRNESVAAGIELAGKDAALREVARLAKRSPLLDEATEDDILEGLKAREALGSTGFGKGIAIPHCRLASAQGFVVGLISVPKGVEFESLDEAPARLIAFIVAPACESNDHVRLLSAVSRALMEPGAVDEMAAAATPEALVESFLRQTDAEPVSRERDAKSLVHLFCQDEDLFRELLQVFASLEGCSTLVIESENAGVYLAKLPLFAGFWQDSDQQFCRVIMGTIDRRLTNEALRRIQTVTGNLDERQDVLVAIQDLTFTAGALSA